MGPYSEELQAQRARSVQRILAQDLTEDARRIWTNHLRNLARTESQYNARVRMLYANRYKNEI